MHEYLEDVWDNAVCPTFIRTPLMERGFLASAADRAQTEAALAAIQPKGRMGTPEEVAAAVVWLCSDAASFITGLAMPIDGGMMAR